MCRHCQFDLAANCLAFDAKKYFEKDERKSLKMMARTVQMGVGCAKARISKIPGRFVDRLTRLDSGSNSGRVLIPTELDDLAPAAVMCTDSAADERELRQVGHRRHHPGSTLWMLKYLPNMVACHVSIMLDCTGPKQQHHRKRRGCSAGSGRGGTDYSSRPSRLHA